MKLTFALSVFSLTLLPTLALAAKDRPQPQPKHAKATLSCYNCHQEENPTSGTGVTEAACMACHGDLPELAVTTKALPVNPHAQRPAPHPRIPACKECHRQHAAPRVTCLECHPTFKFTVK